LWCHIIEKKKLCRVREEYDWEPEDEELAEENLPEEESVEVAEPEQFQLETRARLGGDFARCSVAKRRHP